MRAKRNGYFGFVCSTHVKDKNLCSLKAIPEEAVKSAFATMMNKLIWGRESILLPYMEMLRRDGNAASEGRLAELEELLDQNARRKEQVWQFFLKRLLDPEVYAEEDKILSEEAARLTKEHRILAAQAAGEQSDQTALAAILKFTAQNKMLTEFDETLFSMHVDHVVVYSRTEIGFAMKCGPVFRERI